MPNTRRARLPLRACMRPTTNPRHPQRGPSSGARPLVTLDLGRKRLSFQGLLLGARLQLQIVRQWSTILLDLILLKRVLPTRFALLKMLRGGLGVIFWLVEALNLFGYPRPLAVSGRWEPLPRQRGVLLRRPSDRFPLRRTSTASTQWSSTPLLANSSARSDVDDRQRCPPTVTDWTPHLFHARLVAPWITPKAALLAVWE